MDFKNKAFLAPMAGDTDIPMRRLCRSLGADGAVTEMVSARAVCYGDEKTGALASVGEGEVTAVQLFGHEPEVVARAADMILSGKLAGAAFLSPVAAIDINMGCPVKKIVTSGDGSALMRDEKTASAIVRETAKITREYGVPLTVKIRAGWDAEHVNAPEFAYALAEAGADAVTVHARTREQMYRPFADPEVIRRVKEAIPEVPVIGNGDVTCAEGAFELMRSTGCDGVMIGREALGNPWVFEEIKCAREGRSFSPPSGRERVETALALIRGVIELKGEYVGVREARGRAAHFIKGMRGAPEVRDRINHAETYTEIEKIMTGLFAREV